MPTDLENLQTAKSALITQIAALSASLASTSGGSGHSVDGVSMNRQTAEQRLKSLNDMLMSMNLLIQQEEQPIEIITYGYPQ